MLNAGKIRGCQGSSILLFNYFSYKTSNTLSLLQMTDFPVQFLETFDKDQI